MGTGIEPQRNPTGLGVAISSVPTHTSSLEFSEFDEDDDGNDDNSFAMSIRFRRRSYGHTRELG